MLRCAAALISALAIAGCGSSENAEEARISGDALTVYSSLPQTGPLAPLSRDIVRAEKLALAEAGGRAGDFRVSFVSLDSADPETGAWSPQRVAENARAAVEDLQTIAYLGELEPGASTVSLPILNAGGMLQVSPGDTFAGLTERGAPAEPDRYYPSARRTFTRVVPHDGQAADKLLRTMRRRGVRRAWIADDRQVAARALADRIAAGLRERGVEVAGRARLDPRGEVPDDLAEDVREDRADAFVYTGVYRPFALDVLRAVAAGAPRAALYGADGLAAAPALASRAPERLVVAGVVPRRDPAFARRFRARYGHEPEPRAVLGYDAMRLVLRAIERAGADASRRPAVIREALRMASRPPSRFVPLRLRDGRLLPSASDR